MSKVLTTTHSLLTIPGVDYEDLNLELDLIKLELWKANIEMRELKGDE